MFERMRSELNHMEKELTHCKKLREQQATEFSQKLQEENRKTGEKFTNLAKRHEQEVTQVKREHKIEVDIVRKEMEKRRVILCLFVCMHVIVHIFTPVLPSCYLLLGHHLHTCTCTLHN